MVFTGVLGHDPYPSERSRDASLEAAVFGGFGKWKGQKMAQG